MLKRRPIFFKNIHIHYFIDIVSEEKRRSS